MNWNFAGLLLATVSSSGLAQGAPINSPTSPIFRRRATVGTNWKNGIDVAIEEINAKGGVLGRSSK